MLATALLIAWCWTNDAGTFVCTDTEKNIPAHDRPRAERVEIGPLAEYERLTIDQTWSR